MQLRDFHRDLAYDTLYLPMDVFKPFIPLHLTFGAFHRENPTQKYSVGITLTMEKADIGADKVGGLVAVAIESAQFTP